MEMLLGVHIGVAFFYTRILFSKNKDAILEHFSFTWLSNTLIFDVKEWYSNSFFWQILSS